MYFDDGSTSIEEFFTPEEYEAIPQYERIHLSSLRQMYEALKKQGIVINPPHFMREKKQPEPENGPAPSVESSGDSDFEWTPQFDRQEDLIPEIDTELQSPQTQLGDIIRSRPNKRNKEQTENDSTETTHYTFREIRPIRYMSLAVPDEDDFLYCEECNVEYPCDCPIHGPLLVINDRQVPKVLIQSRQKNPDYCVSTLPDGLEIRPSRMKNAGLGVFATKYFPARTRFGPYKGTVEKNETAAHNSGYCWQIYKDGKPSHFVDAKNPCKSNWMRFVNCALTEEEQSLTAYQHGGQIFYRAHQDILPGMELLVYYGDSYAAELSIPFQRVTGCMREPEQRFEVNHGLQSNHKTPTLKQKTKSPTSTTLKIPHKSKNTKDQSSHNVQDILPLSGNTPSDVLEKKELVCVSCCKIFGTCMIQKDVLNYLGQWVTYKCSGCSIFDDNGTPQYESEADELASNSFQMFDKHGHFSYESEAGADISNSSVDGQASVDCSSLPSHCTTQREENSFKCTVCWKTFSGRGYLERHMNRHAREKTFKCSVCNEVFSDDNRLQQHMGTHKAKNLQQGGNSGKSKIDIATHHQKSLRNGSRKKVHTCSICYKTLSSCNSLQNHVRTHTGEKPFMCSICDRAFGTKGNFKRHMRIHTGEKPFQCSICDKKFIQKSDLNMHMRIHTNEKPFQCSLCEKKFNRKDFLSDHMRTHTKEKPFQCSFCKRKYCSKGSLHKHLKKSHIEKQLESSVSTESLHNRSHCQSDLSRRSHCQSDLSRRSHCPSDLSRSHCPSDLSRSHCPSDLSSKSHCPSDLSRRSHCPSDLNRRSHCPSDLNRSPCPSDLSINSRAGRERCNVCNKVFSSSYLKIHMKVHCGEKQYSCLVCNTAFRDSDSHKRHVKTHF